MPNPIRQDIHVDRPLTNMSVAYIQKVTAFIAAQMFPVIGVQKQSDRYFVYDKGDWFRDEAKERIPGVESAGGGYDIDNTPSYFCKAWGYHQDVTDADRANSDSPLAPDRDATEFVTQKLLIRREVEWVTRFFSTGIWTTEWTGAAARNEGALQFKYWNLANSTPIDDIAFAQISIQAITGMKPNVLAIGPWVYKALRNHADILDRIKYTERGIVTKELLAALFDVDKVVVAEGVRNTAAKGASDAVNFIAGKHAMLAYAEPNPGLKKPSAGYIFAWNGLLGAGAYGNTMARIPMPWLGRGTERIEGEMAFDANVIAADLGFFYNGIVQ